MMRSVLLLVCLTSAVQAQTLDGSSTVSERAVPFYLRLVLPTVVTGGYALRHYLLSVDLSDSVTAREAFDVIYLDALDLAHGNVTDALLISALASLEHESIPLHTFGTTIDVPLSTESHYAFETRVAHLPRHLYGTPEDDRDKLQHFFASAWTKRMAGMTWLARWAGELVEMGEQAFSIDGAEDPRDLRADEDGIRFGTVAGNSLELVPSAFLSPNP